MSRTNSKSTRPTAVATINEAAKKQAAARKAKETRERKKLEAMPAEQRIKMYKSGSPEYRRLYNQIHRDEIRSNSARYYAENRETILEKKRQRRVLANKAIAFYLEHTN